MCDDLLRGVLVWPVYYKNLQCKIFFVYCSCVVFVGLV